jgi:small subunit ribosomal protein S20
MPHTRSAKKNLRKAEKRRLHNRTVIRALKKQLKVVLTTAAEGSLEALQKEYNVAAMKLDKAAARKAIHRNLASRKKSQLARLVQKKKAGAAAPKPA